MTDEERAGAARAILAGEAVCHKYADSDGLTDDSLCVLCGKTFRDMRHEPLRVSVFATDHYDPAWPNVHYYCDWTEKRK